MKYVSLFSGIEAASVAWEPLGWKAIAFSEIEKFPCEVLATHYPDVPNLGDISNIDWSDIGAVDLIVGGSPCQAFSVAGKRRGLMDERGRLMLEFVRAVRDIHPRWLLWENVPGVFSQSGGDAFETFQEELEKCGYSLAWRTLDAQFFGVAQRRRRVFLVGHARAECAAAVLFERESLRWDYPTSKEKRKSLTRDVETGTRKRMYGFSYKMGAKAGSIGAETEIAPTLKASSHDAAVCLPFDTTQITSPTNGNNPQWGDPCHTLSAGANAPTIITQYGDIAGTLTARFDSSPCPDRGQTIVAYPIAGNIIGRAEENGGHQLGVGSEYDPMFTLDTLGAHGVVCSNGKDYVGALCARDHKGVGSQFVNEGKVIAQNSIVRRLTPLECERLQGFPDGYTDIYENTPDTPRYKALGNSMAVPVMRWIGERIEKVERLQHEGF